MSGVDKNGVRHKIYVDFIITMCDRIAFIEFDERQHNVGKYDSNYQQQRAEWIHQHAINLGKRPILLRFSHALVDHGMATSAKGCNPNRLRL